MKNTISVKSLPDINDTLKKAFSDEEISEAREEARKEAQYLRVLQDDLSRAVHDLMTRENIGFNELGRRLGMSPRQVSKIVKGSGNLTLETIARVASLFDTPLRITP